MQRNNDYTHYTSTIASLPILSDNGSPMPDLKVDPAALNTTGSGVSAEGDRVVSVMDTLSSGLSSTGKMAGNDPAGIELGKNYDKSAAKLMEVMASAGAALNNIGVGVQTSAYNYSMAETHSDVSHTSGALTLPVCTTPADAASAPGAVGVASAIPAGWSLVAPYLGMVWPTGDPGRLRQAAQQWRTAGSSLTSDALTKATEEINSQIIPESASMDSSIEKVSGSLSTAATQCEELATTLDSYADTVEKAHSAILDLLSRICNPLTPIKEHTLD